MYDTALYKPKTSERFASLMELYEQNYVLVRLLLPELKTLSSERLISFVPEAMPLELCDVTHSRYTTTFTLTYRFSENSERKGRARQICEPDLSIRLYHDARTCEVMSGLLPEGRLAVRRTRDLQEGQRLNRFLNKWLSFCLRQGHSFSPNTLDEPQRTTDYCTQC